MRKYILVLWGLFTLALSSSEYYFQYNSFQDLPKAYYNKINEANIQYKIIEYIIPLDESVTKVELDDPQYILSKRKIELYKGDASISDGFFSSENSQPSPIFPQNNSIKYNNYYKQGVNILVLKLPYESYNYIKEELSTLKEGLIKISTIKNNTAREKANFLTNTQDFSSIIKNRFIDNNVKNTYYSLYNYANNITRNALNIDPAEMLIISPTNLLSSWTLYATYKSNLGISTQVIDIATITSIYPGRDNAEKLRNFLVEVYTEWSNNEIPLRYVLLGGDYNLIPIRLLRIKASYNGSWHSNDLYSDLYYAGLDGTWDNDNDNLFGEGDLSQDSQATGSNGEEADLYAEVYVGRIPVENVDEFENWMNKQVDYETTQVSEDFYEKVLLLGEYLGSSIYGAPSMNELGNYLEDFSLETLYSQNGTFSESSLTNSINNNVSQVHHLGHGSTSAVFSISDSDIQNNFINQDYPLIYTQGCHTANLSVNDAIGEKFVTNARGAFAYIGNTSYGFYSSFENQGPSQLFHREFVDAYCREGFSKIGVIHLDGKEDLVGITDQTGTRRYVFFDNILFADPSTAIIKEIESVKVEQISDTSIQLTYSDNMASEALDINNYTIYQRDNIAIIYPLDSITHLANIYELNFTSELPKGLPLRIKIENIPNLINPSIKLVKSLYTIKESSIITPTVWTLAESPIYVYKHQIINSILTIEAGTEIRINSNKNFYLYWGGEIRVNGDSLNYVTFTSYSDDSNNVDQWSDITLMMEASNNSYINYAHIRNSETALWLDSLSTISLDHVRFSNNTNYGLYAKHADVTAQYIESTGLTTNEGVAIRIIGGDVNIDHLTSANNNGWDLVVTDSANLSLSNSIIWGQTHFDSETVSINYSILPTTIPGVDNLTSDPSFVSTSDFSLQSSSPAINSGDSNILDPDNTITDRGYWYFYHPNTFQAEIISSSPKQINFTNQSLGTYDSIQWDFENDGIWDSYGQSTQHLYLTEGSFTVKMRLNKATFQQDIFLTDLLEQNFIPLPFNFPLFLSIANNSLQIEWNSITAADLYKITAANNLATEFSTLSIQAENSYSDELGAESIKFYQVIPLQQNISISD